MTSKSAGERNRHRKVATQLINGGRDPFAHHGYVNTPVYHASTLLYPSAEDFLAHRGRYSYGRRGTPTSEALQTALADLEGPQCEAVTLLPSGLAAISMALLSVVRTGDHVLVTDSAYGPTRKVCDTILPRYGVTATYYDPVIGGGIGRAVVGASRRLSCARHRQRLFSYPHVLRQRAVALWNYHDLL